MKTTCSTVNLFCILSYFVDDLESLAESVRSFHEVLTGDGDREVMANPQRELEDEDRLNSGESIGFCWKMWKPTVRVP